MEVSPEIAQDLREISSWRNGAGILNDLIQIFKDGSDFSKNVYTSGDLLVQLL